MDFFRTILVEVKAAQFFRSRKPWPEDVETIYAEGIPRPMVVTPQGNIDVRDGDWIVRGPWGTGIAVMTNVVFHNLFAPGRLPVEEPEVSLEPDVVPAQAIDPAKVKADLVKMATEFQKKEEPDAV